MKLYYNPMSPNCRRVLATAYHLNSNLELQTVDFEKYDEAAFSKMNPNGMIPILEDGSFHVWESNAIMQYLCDQKSSNDLLPKDVKGRTDVTRWQFWQMAHFGPACSTLVWENFLKGMFGAGEPDQALVKEGLAEFRQFAGVLDKHLQGRKFIVGDQVTIADFSNAAYLALADQSKMPIGEFPNVKKWYANVDALDAWKKSAPKM